MVKPFLIFSFFIFNLFLFILSAKAEVSLGVGPEYFWWREFNPDGSKALEESGFRYSISLDLEQEKQKGFLFGYRGKLYIGEVQYNGMTLEPGTNPPTPVKANTVYSGFRNEGLFIFRHPLNDIYTLDLITSLGWDHWSRNINSNQLEEYDILFLSMGPLFKNKMFWFGAGGKFPLYTFENAHIDSVCSVLSMTYPQFSNCVDKNPPLHPGRQLSLYVNTGYHLSSLWTITFFYDSYRFSKSSNESDTQHGFYQPESIMDLIGVQGIYHFP